MAAQIVLVGSVLFLVNDRLSGPPDTGVQQSSTQMALQLEHSQHLLAQHDTALNTLRTDLEETTELLRAQRKRMLDVQTQLSRSTESSLALQSQLLQVRQDQNHEAQALAHQMTSEVKPALEAMHSQQQLMAQDLETLSTTRKSVQQDIARLDSHAKDLRQTLSEQRTLLASIAASANSAAPIAKKAGDAVTSPPSSPPLLAELQKETTPAQFTFWVSFQDGTPEKNIEELIQEIHGKKGDTNAGWYAVEVPLGGTQQPDAFADSLRKAKIVKAVTTTLNTASAK
jgi:predicted  nucleic acid-binding Zn-ribbon protein